MNVDKHIEYWRAGAEEDFEFAAKCMRSGQLRYGLFFAHLALEKTLKAHVVRSTGSFAPKTHKLARLAELAKLPVTNDQIEFLREFSLYQSETRYPAMSSPTADSETMRADFQHAKELLIWLTELLKTS